MVPPIQARRLCASVGLLAVLAIAGGAAAEDRPWAAPHHAGLHTGALSFPAPGVMRASLGVEYMPAISNDLAGVHGELLRAPTLGLELGLADHAVFMVSWPAYNRLRVHSQVEPPPLGRKLGRVSSDWGDLTVATLIRLYAGHGRWPGAGIRFAAKLPNSNEKLGIGENTTDVFATALLARSFGRRLSLYADLGLGILTKPASLFAQDDVFSYGLMVDARVRERLRAVAEVTGHAATHTPAPGTGDQSELRAGLELTGRTVHWSALAVRSLRGPDSGLGVSLNASTSFSVLRPATRAR